MLTHLLRLTLARSIKPFLFTAVPPEQEATRREGSFLSDNIGLYIHIPFCEALCDFCPYYKVVYQPELMRSYIVALLKELEFRKVNLPEKYRITSLYFGGGSPALALEYLPEILEAVKRHYGVPESIGLELHPRDINEETLDRLKSLGVSMVSLGAQSFSEASLRALGREGMNGDGGFSLITEKGFIVIDTDLIFAIPGQTEETLESDFRRALELGATQVSTYPFIRFSYAGRRYANPSKSQQRRLLGRLTALSDELGLARTSVWTFGRRDRGQYSSVTRDNVLGFGASATSLFRERFAINTFSIQEYCRCLEARTTPQALELRFSPRVRKMYWLFWSSYNLRISDSRFREYFGLPLAKEFPVALAVGTWFGLLRKDGDDYRLTDVGAMAFHRVEQIYTHQYIDKTWRICTVDRRPKRIGLF